MRIDVLGIGFDNINKEKAVEYAIEAVEQKKKAYAVTPNPEIVWECRKNERLRDIVNRADLVLPDGIGIIYAAKILKTPLACRVPGIEFAEALLERFAQSGMSVFLLGAKPGVADMAAEKMAERYPNLIIAGTQDGYFKDSGAVVDIINRSLPDAVFVCLGSPKQEIWISENLDKINTHFMIGLGGSLDVFAGAVERAPEKWRKLGLEWLYRLLKEPKRLRRMMKLPMFMAVVIWHRIFGKKR